MTNKINMFVEVMASKRSFSCRRLVRGIGINDAEYMTEYVTEGIRTRCPYYIIWFSMLNRCYSKLYQKRQPTYEGCAVTKEWFLFSNFRSWMEAQDWEGKALDKDIIKPGNKVYSPSTCAFVTQEVNNLVCKANPNRWKLPQGVYYFKPIGKFQVYCTVKGTRKHLGYFNTSDEAATAYNYTKSQEIRRVADLQTDSRIRDGLLKHVELRCNS